MPNTNLLQRTEEAFEIVNNLRSNIDIMEIIAVNAKEINELGCCKSFFGHSQNTAHKMISLDICRLFEIERKYPLNSLPGILKAICGQNIILSKSDLLNKEAEHLNYKNLAKDVNLGTQELLDRFVKNYKEEFRKLKIIRDKYIAHSEAVEFKKRGSSLDTYERFYTFSYALSLVFVESVSMGAMPTPGRYVRTGLIEMLKRLGIESPRQSVPHKD